MATNWYIIHVYSGYENKVLAYIEKNIKQRGEYSGLVGDVKIPLEDIIEMRDGKKRKLRSSMGSSRSKMILSQWMKELMTSARCAAIMLLSDRGPTSWPRATKAGTIS